MSIEHVAASNDRSFASQREHLESTQWVAAPAAKKRRFASNVDNERVSPDRSSALEENVQAIKRWERAVLFARSKAEQVSERPFDPFPFPFLTMTLSLEAIFLDLFAPTSQNRLARQADRSHLDLQIDPLAEREMTS